MTRRRLAVVVLVALAACSFGVQGASADEKDGDPKAGCIEDPVTGECFGKAEDDDSGIPVDSKAGKRSKRTPTA